MFSTSIPQHYFSVNHTMCPIQMNNSMPYAASDDDTVSPPLPLFFIDVYTYSSKPLFYSIFVEPVDDFVLK